MKSFLASAAGGAVVCVLFLVVLLIVNPAVLGGGGAPRTGGDDGPPPAAVSGGSLASAFLDAIPAAAEKITPSVVFIDTKGFAEVEQPVFNIFGLPFKRTQVVPRGGSGSGVVIDSSGLIMTNEHVVHDATEIMVTFSDNRTCPAVVKGADAVSDIAVIKVSDVDGLVPASLSDSDKLRIGEPVIAVGSPYNFQQTVTFGVISGRGRNLSDQTKDFQDLLQIDAAINPGNSGGPLVNLKGEVVGINTAIIPYAQGIGFAIPINTARNIADQLIASGKVVRSYIGIGMQDLNPRLASYLGFKGVKGAVVLGVEPGRPAAVAGLRPKDIILRADGKEIGSCDDLRQIIRRSKPGDEIALSVWREGSEFDVALRTAGK